MTSFLLTLLVGIIIGWNVEQPQWAKDAQNKLLEFIGQRPRD